MKNAVSKAARFSVYLILIVAGSFVLLTVHRAQIKRLFVQKEQFLTITPGMSLPSLRDTLGIAFRHRFTITKDGAIYTGVLCLVPMDGHSESPLPVECYPFMLLFRDQTLLKIVETPPWTQPKVRKFEYTDYITEVLDAHEIHLRRILRDLEPYTGPGSNGSWRNMPPLILFAPLFMLEDMLEAPIANHEYAINEKLLRRYDGFQPALGMTTDQVDGLYGKPAKILPMQDGQTACLYGNARELAEVDDAVKCSWIAVVFDREGRVSAVYADGFFDKHWLDRP